MHACLAAHVKQRNRGGTKARWITCKAYQMKPSGGTQKRVP